VDVAANVDDGLFRKFNVHQKWVFPGIALKKKDIGKSYKDRRVDRWTYCLMDVKAGRQAGRKEGRQEGRLADKQESGKDGRKDND
jgi:hypothetical protein